MATESPEPVFEESDDLPTGRKARSVPQYLWRGLEESAERVKAKVTPAMHPDNLREVRKHLTSAAVQAKFDVTTETIKTMDHINGLTRAEFDKGLQKLKFAAARKPQSKATPVK